MTGRRACHGKHWLFEMRIVSVFTRLRLQHRYDCACSDGMNVAWACVSVSASLVEATHISDRK